VKIAIVGLPNAGKSTLFNALTAAGAETAGYPFTTVDPNVAVVPVPDERLPLIAAATGASPEVPETIEFRDVAGLVRGAASGEGLGNRFLAEIRETDAVCHVVRTHEDADVPHPDGRVDPLADAEVVEAELLLADLEQAERRLERIRREAGSQAPEAIAERDWLEAVIAALEAGAPVRSVPAPEAAPRAAASLQALTAKPVLFVANSPEGDLDPPPALAAHAASQGTPALTISAAVESDLAELPPGEALPMRAELGLPKAGIERVVRASYELLGLITFFTAHRGAEAAARALPAGATAYEAAGRVHTDIQRGFARAEVIGWEALVEAGGYAEARERGTLRTEGRDYVVSEGDVITIKH
jgi:GTP-binding protein YchF